MRLFISVNLPSEIENCLKTMQAKIEPNSAKLSLARSLHLTLKFLGEIDENKVLEVKELLGHVSFNKFKANITSVGVFPNDRNIRIIWIGAEPKERFKALFEQINKQISQFAKFAKNEHEFKAHITLARVKFVKDKELLKKSLKSLKEIKLEKKEFDVDAFYLMKSTLTPEGPVYEVVERFGLR